jgi:hypothetical protein
VDRVLQTAAGLAERAVLVAVAREAVGRAARVVASEQGPERLEEIAAALEAGAFELFDALLAVRDGSRRRRGAVRVG